MQLSAVNMEQLRSGKAEWPDTSIMRLPEKVIQFGTGVLLRGLPDYFIDKANKQGLFNGRIVVVKSTDKGDTGAFDAQNGLFTLLERGYELGNKTEKIIVNASISRVLSAARQWQDILVCAENPDIQIIISNTTEVGIALVASDATAEFPVSYPGKLLAFLLRRYSHFNGAQEAGMVIVPTELITDNGAKLKAIVVELARLKGSAEAFIEWLCSANDFCSSLVDRIVPGKPATEEQQKAEKALGYKDELMIMSETYRLWAIETNSERTRNILSFALADTGVVLAKNINRYRELKLRLLNGSHSFSCALAVMSGFRLVRDAMFDKDFASFMSTLMLEEIAPLVAVGDIGKQDAKTFALQVIDRFKNPYIDHQWVHIAVQYTSKMIMRNLPLIQSIYQSGEIKNTAMALGFAAYLHVMKPLAVENDKQFVNQQGMALQDDKLVFLFNHWQKGLSEEATVKTILADQNIWGVDLSQYPHFVTAVTGYYLQLATQHAMNVCRALLKEKRIV